jgi:4-aminobutyrate aminotransferase-like enzyme
LPRRKRQSDTLSRNSRSFKPPFPTSKMLGLLRTSPYVFSFRSNQTCDTVSFQVHDVGAAHPRITEAVENMVKKGKWTVPGMS